MLDQLSGALRHDENGQVVGLDVAPSLTNALQASQNAFAGFEVTLIVPQTKDTDSFSEQRFTSFEHPGLRITSVPPVTYSDATSDTLSTLSAPKTPTAFVSADHRLRGDAAKTGFHATPHPTLLPMMAQGHTPLGARLTGPKDALQRFATKRAVVPMSFQPTQDERDWALIALMSDEDLSEAALQQFGVLPLDYDPRTEDLLWARPDGKINDTRHELKGRRLIYAEPHQVLIALTPRRTPMLSMSMARMGIPSSLPPTPGFCCRHAPTAPILKP